MPIPSRRPPKSCEDCSLKEHCILSSLDGKISQAVGAIRGQTRKIESGHILCHEGDDANTMFTIYDGWAVKYRILETGKRQIVTILLPGDLVGEYSEKWAVWQYTVEMISPSHVCTINRKALAKLRIEYPPLAEAIINISRANERITAEHLVFAAGRSARDGLLHLLLEIYVRLDTRSGGNQQQSYFVPLTQSHMADLLGLSTEYVNRLMSDLRTEGEVYIHKQRLFVKDFPKIAEDEGFDSSYLTMSKAS